MGWVHSTIHVHTKQINHLKSAEQLSVGGEKVDTAEALTISGKEGLRSRTRTALCYDMFCMALCFAIILYFEGSVELDDWQRRQLFFWSHALYGILSLPFILTMLPVAHLLFNAAPATGYARSGQCLRMNLDGEGVHRKACNRQFHDVREPNGATGRRR